MTKSYYLILGVAANASAGDLKAAFRRRARELRPDISGRESEPFLELSEAYAVLSDPQRRQQYDHGILSTVRCRQTWRAAAPMRPQPEPFRRPGVPGNLLAVLLEEAFERESLLVDRIFLDWLGY